MSFDQLPNELIARIGSFLTFKDKIQFGLCQKRIHAVLKRDGLLKPECERLQFTTVAQPHCKFWLLDSTKIWKSSTNWKSLYIKEKRDPKFNSVVGQIINKFRKIEVIDWQNDKVTEDVFKDLMKTKTKLSSLSMYFGEVDIVDPNIFIAACKRFDKIDLETKLPRELLCDQVFIELLPIMTFANSVYRSIDGYLLTDRTLKVLTFLEVKKSFDIGGVFTSFTIAAIKTLVEELLKTKALDVTYNLGILKFSEERNVVRWMEEVAAYPDCPFIIRRRDLFRGKFPYMIKLKDDTRRKIDITFAINQVEL